MQQIETPKTGIMSNAPVVIGIVIVGFCVMSVSAGFAVAGAWYMLEGPKPAVAGAKPASHKKHHKNPLAQPQDAEDESDEPAAQAAAPAPAPVAPAPGGRKLGVTPTASTPPGPGAPPAPAGVPPMAPPPGGPPHPAPGPQAAGAPAPAAAPAAPARKGRFSNSTPDPNAAPKE